MKRFSVPKFGHLGFGERRSAIAELVEKAVRLFHRSERSTCIQAQLDGTASSGRLDRALLTDDPTEQSIIRYLARVGAASPHDFCIALGIARPTAVRKLRRLRMAGLIVVTGRTRSASYRLRTEFAAN